ncbi:class I SAM-dependent methyltransferase [Granulosicoccaceae sp. 1_MG-2023]|nr:class I SAM-dependent methyltransferase [Granulosicoccaceae sp. 1_MG-2023]
MSESTQRLLPECKPPYPLPENEAQRLFHGRGGAHPGLEHIVIDWLPPVMLVTLYAAITDDERDALSTHLLQHNPACETLLFQYRYLRDGPVEAVQGSIPTLHVVEEAGLQYEMSFGSKRNTGLFLDMRNGRQWVRQQAAGKRVLNLFAYTCAFSVAAVAGGAQSVMSVDMSSAALSGGRRNHRLNGQSTGQVSFAKLEIFRSFGRLKRAGPFDLLICDPPTLQKGSVDIERDYPKIIRRLDQFMAPACDLLMCLNAPHLSDSFLTEAMRCGAPSFEFVGRIAAPEAFAEPRGGGLKTLHFRR